MGGLAPLTINMSATEREARENLVTSIVARIAAAGGVNAATATGAGQMEVENNQLAMPSAAPPSWLPGIKGIRGSSYRDDGLSLQASRQASR